MANKRGRPISGESDSSTVNHQREQARERMQRLREQRRQARTAAIQPTPEQLQQGEYIVNLTAVEEEAAPPTLSQVGLRIQDVTLAQDFVDAHLQEEATAVDEHDEIYDSAPLENPAYNESKATPSNIFKQFSTPLSEHTASKQPKHGRDDASGIPQYFRSLPPNNPFAARRTSQPPEPTESADYVDDDDYTLFQIEEIVAEPTISDLTITEPSAPTAETSLRGSEDQIVESASEDEIENEEQQQSDSESFHDFVSEHSAHNDDAAEDAEVSAVDYMADKLYSQLILQFHGCSEEKHTEKLRSHMDAADDNHYGLNEVSNDPDFPSVLGLAEMISPERLARQAQPSPQQWSSIYSGVSRQRRTPMNVCLHKEQTQAVMADVAYDVDSFLGFASSLKVASKGVWMQPVSQMRQNMTADNHIQTTMFSTGPDPEQPLRSSSVMLRDVPHFLFGRIVGAHDITIHVLFPHMATIGEKFVSLTREQMTRWLDDIFLPALHTYYDPHYTQHLPSSFRHAFANSKAHQVENRQVETASYQAQQSIGFHLQPEKLDAMWSIILQTVANTPGLAEFREPQLFLSAKGTKLQFKTSPSGTRSSLLDAMEYFESVIEDVLNLNFVQLDRFYVDVGKEICAGVSLLASQQVHVGDEPHVYLPRRCCQEEYMQWMYDGQPPRKGKGQQYFSTNMLYDASSLTSVTPKQSKQREGGLIYTQMYASVKEISDATKCFPWNNDGLEELALDPEIRKGAHQAAGGHRRSAKILEFAYLASKRRTRDALLDSRQKSFGIREEHRITWELFQGLKLRLQQDGAGANVELVDCPTHAWPVKTSVYLDFLWRSADKFATGFEVIRARCRRDLVTWEQTKMMAMFLRCLRFIFGGHLLSRESPLWWSRRERQVGEPARLRVWYGLGFCNTLSRYGYCWLEPRIDWGRLQFKMEVTDQMLFGNNMLRGQYLRRGGQVQAFFDMTRRMELALEWLGLHKDNEAIRKRMLLWIVHICLQQFRIDVLRCVKTEIRAEQQEEALKGSSSFCYELLEEILADGVYLMSGNRCDFKIVSWLGRFLFDAEDGKVRNHWEDRPYRKLYRRARTAVGLHGREMRHAFAQGFWKALYQHHWILPYPCSDALMQTTKQGRRMWYSIHVRDGVNAREAEEKDWGWARKGWETGRPKGIPRWMEWSKEEWEEWIEQRGEIE